ncbi:hypothetical protein NDU88_005287 [Pleurodeles waltl]|uniref:Uncharacterized protein n=1 Tax=Pleurodeles waltl TaxID=8319 RepID=A0AAV7PHM9_PLEWA|nr:hypothetical protein NDU88_005287 [Pleurodeles waltl]
MSRSQPSTSATKSSSSVVPASLGTSKAAPIRADSVPPSQAKDHPIPPPAKVKKWTTCRRERPHKLPSKASSKTKEDSAKVPAVTSKVGKGHKAKGKASQGTEPPGEGLVTPLLLDRTATCMAMATATTTATCTPTSTSTCTPTCTATCTPTCTPTCTSAASATVSSIIPSGQPSEAAGDVLLSHSTGADTCTTASISAADTAATTATCPVTCSDSATTADMTIIPSRQSFEAAGDVLDPAQST